MSVDHDADVGADEKTLNPDGAVGPRSERRAARMHRIAGVVGNARDFSWRWIQRMSARWRPIMLALAVVASTAMAGGIYYVQYRPDQLTDDSASRAAVAAASEGTAALLSCTPDTVDHDLTVAKSHLTGEYLRYFTDFGTYFLAPAVRQHSVTASASVLRAAVSQMHPNSAVVLEFLHQTTTSKDKPQPILTTSNVRVTLTKVRNTWLIAKFEPE